MTSEQAIQSQILVAIGALDGVLAWRQNVGVGTTLDGRHARWGTPGQADIICCVRGRFVAIEVKRPRGGRQSRAQKRWQAACEAAGGRYVMARSVADALGVVGEYC